MISLNDQFIGVDLGTKSIKVGVFSSEGQLHCQLDWKLPLPALPGAVTVAICEAIEAVDIKDKTKFVGVCLVGDIDATGRVVHACNLFTGWKDVPLAAWLEPRLDRTVTLGNYSNCLRLGQSWKSISMGLDDVLLPTIGAARLAFEQFTDFVDIFDRVN